MLRTLLTTVAALSLMSGVGFAQSSSSRSTTESTSGVPASHDVDVTTATRRTADRNGVMIDKDTSGTETLTPGVPATTRTNTETTTVR
jgi:hypothetical protein